MRKKDDLWRNIPEWAFKIYVFEMHQLGWGAIAYLIIKMEIKDDTDIDSIRSQLVAEHLKLIK